MAWKCDRPTSGTNQSPYRDTSQFFTVNLPTPESRRIYIMVDRPIFLVGFQPTLAISRGFEPPAGYETNREWCNNSLYHTFVATPLYI